MKNRNIIIVGGDKRQKYLKEYLAQSGFSVDSYGLFDWDDDTDKLKSIINENSAIILPLPATRNGKNINMPFSKKEISVDRLLSFLGKENLVFGGIIKDDLLSRLRETDIPFVPQSQSQNHERIFVLHLRSTRSCFNDLLLFRRQRKSFIHVTYQRHYGITGCLCS